MGWTLMVENQSLYLATEDCQRLRNEKSIQYGPLSAVGCGRTCGEVWFKFQNDKKGKRMLRNLFVSSSEFAKEKKLNSTMNNTDFISILTDNGLEKIGKGSSTNKRGKLAWPQGDGCITPHYTHVDTELQSLIGKCAGSFNVPVRKILPALSAFSVRDINSEWVNKIKESLVIQPTTPVTRIPVLVDRHEVESTDSFKEEMLSSVNLYALGGNHLVQAMKMVLDQNPGNDNYSCLRAIEVEVFCGLTNLEARFVGSAHNKKCNTLKPTFQDKVKNSRGIYEGYANSSEVSWKEACARSLGLLDGKEINKDGIPVILSVASYSSVNYSHVMEIFSQFNRNSPMGTSIPQVLFKNLLSVKDENRTPFLAAAIGTNGVKQARLVLQAKKERLLQQLLAETLGATVDEVLVTHPDEMEAIKQFSDTEVTKSRIPRCILDFLEKVRNSENVDDNTNIEIAITIKIDGKEVVGDSMNMIKRKGIKTMERLVKKMKTNNEE